MTDKKTPNIDDVPSLSDMKAKVQKKAGAKADTKPSASKHASKTLKPVRPKAASKSGVGFGTVAIMSLLAAGIGGAIGWAGPKIFDPANAAPAAAIESQGKRIADLNATIKTQSGQIDGLKSKLATAHNSIESLSKTPARIRKLEASEQARAAIDIAAEREAAITPIAARIDAMETLMQTEDMPEGSASALLTRLAKIEAGLEEIQSRPPAASEPSILTYTTPSSSDTETPELNTLENAREEENASEAAPARYDVIANFPREAMLKALTAQTAASSNPSWIRRIMDKHIDIKDVGGNEARSVIDTAEALVKSGDVSGAIDAIESLNPTLRAAARIWLIEAKKTL